MLVILMLWCCIAGYVRVDGTSRSTEDRLKVDADGLKVVRFSHRKFCHSGGGMHFPRCGLRFCFGCFL